MGLGSTAWGGSAWGAGDVEGIALLSAVPIAENVVRLRFTEAPRLTGLLDPNDASDPARYAVVPIDGTTGLDGLPARRVSPVAVAFAAVAGSGGSLVDVTLDRRLSPYGALYVASCNQLVSMSSGAPLDVGATSVVFDGLCRGLPPNAADRAVARRDVAGPSYAAAARPALSIDATGDYAYDEGLASYKKRIARRMLSRRGGFAHLPDYGVGTPDQVKRLASPAVRGAMAAEAEAQARREPETVDARAAFEPFVGEPGAWRLRLRLRASTGEELSLGVPMRPEG